MNTSMHLVQRYQDEMIVEQFYEKIGDVNILAKEIIGAKQNIPVNISGLKNLTTIQAGPQYKLCN